jgi:hypothetical protein
MLLGLEAVTRKALQEVAGAYAPLKDKAGIRFRTAPCHQRRLAALLGIGYPRHGDDLEGVERDSGSLRARLNRPYN